MLRWEADSARAFALAIGLLAAGIASADVRLPSLIGNGMVLQRDSKIAVWGWADPHEAVRIEFLGAHVEVEADGQGQWSASLGPYPAGGPHVLNIAGKNTIALQDVLIGDVWLASGQSNMEWPLKGLWGASNDADREIAAADFPQIRLFAVKHDTAPRPLTAAASEGWSAVSPERVAGFSAVAYFFGRELHQRYQVPVGLIQSVWGGTVAEAWMSEAGLRRFPEFSDPIKALRAISAKARADYERHEQRQASWYQEHASDDRGRIDGRDVWADPALDVSGWPTISIPRELAACGQDFNGYAGVVWFRRSFEVPHEHIGKPLSLHLGSAVSDDVTYVNGKKIGETRGMGKPRDYVVPAEHLRPGENSLTVRLTGINHALLACTALYGPVEQVHAEIGGTKIPIAGVWSYMPGPDLGDFPRADAKTLAANPAPNTPTALFNAMINPLVPARIRGVIWYQGESNADRATQYRTLFPALIQDWRRHWGYELPFLFVQLAGFGANKEEPAEYPWAELREAQSMALTQPATAMATAIDIGDEKDIHPTNKQDVGRRLALAAARVVYAEDVVHSGPTYRAMHVEGSRVRIEFSNVGSGLQVRDKYGYARGFEIAGADGRFHWARAQQNDQGIVVSSERVREPVAVRYAWSNTPDGNVYNKEGLPAVPFRTDGPKLSAAPDP